MSEIENAPFDDAEWVLQMAELEDRCASVSAGGLAVDVDLFQSAPQSADESIAREALAKLVAYTRRQMGVTLATFAAVADMQVADVLRLEHAEWIVLNPKAWARLAETLSVPVSSLMKLVGHSQDDDSDLHRAARLFAAGAEPLQVLTDAEQTALRNFVSELSKRPQGV